MTDDAPRTIFHHTKIVTTRKPHPCYLCNRELPTGTRAVKEFSMTTDDIGPRGTYCCAPALLNPYACPFERAEQTQWNESHPNNANWNYYTNSNYTMPNVLCTRAYYCGYSQRHISLVMLNSHKPTISQKHALTRAPPICYNVRGTLILDRNT